MLRRFAVNFFLQSTSSLPLNVSTFEWVLLGRMRLNFRPLRDIIRLDHKRMALLGQESLARKYLTVTTVVAAYWWVFLLLFPLSVPSLLRLALLIADFSCRTISITLVFVNKYLLSSEDVKVRKMYWKKKCTQSINRWISHCKSINQSINQPINQLNAWWSCSSRFYLQFLVFYSFCSSMRPFSSLGSSVWWHALFLSVWMDYQSYYPSYSPFPRCGLIKKSHARYEPLDVCSYTHCMLSCHLF